MSLKKRHVIKKIHLDSRVALLLGGKHAEVAAVTKAFLDAMADELSSLNDVHLLGLGKLHVALRRGPGITPDKHWKKKYHVTFKKSAGLSRRFRERHGDIIEEKVMEKLGVDESQADNEKVASNGCPECGAKPERHGNVLSCPVHGTEPFEGAKKS